MKFRLEMLDSFSCGVLVLDVNVLDGLDLGLEIGCFCYVGLEEFVLFLYGLLFVLG